MVDVNADLGEGFGAWRLGDDAAMLDLVTSANIACGFHAGDPATLWETCAAAARANVVIGAQVSYPDLLGFGRRFLDIAPKDLTAAVVYQIGALDAIARCMGSRVRYVKAHGALYHALTEHEGQAAAFAQAVADFDARLPVLHYGGAISAKAEAQGLRLVAEAYADRAYTPQGTLVPRDEPGAVLADPTAIAEQAARLANEGKAESICVHGDTPGAVSAARAIRKALADEGIEVRSFL
ncbi:MAG: LamB/YcsF family protein [Segniliparus sp.]|uniref:LamB/YcsF family protein n=1 Tax=Segniliparus sp. TaxID=2804064 RepID=UPI003F41A22B